MLKMIPLTILVALVASGCFTTVKPQQLVKPEEIAKMESFSYGDWQHVLKAYVDQAGRVDYEGLRTNRVRLDRYISLIGVVGPKTKPGWFESKPQRLAYYINAYNALTLFNVINRLPELQSVNDDLKSFFYFTTFELDGENISLYALENDLIRPRFREPRIHFALNCASIGCPQLPAEAFLPESLDAQLKRETQKFLNERRNVAFENDKIVLSQIFNWYEEDFPPSALAWIRTQTPDLVLPKAAAVIHRPYDWDLNRQSPASSNSAPSAK